MNIDKYLKATSDNIKGKMKENNISIAELSTLIGIDPSELSKCLSDVASIQSDILVLISKALNTSPNELMGFE